MGRVEEFKFPEGKIHYRENSSLDKTTHIEYNTNQFAIQTKNIRRLP